MAVAPFHAGLINLKPGDAATDKACAEIYDGLTAAGVEVLYDETRARPGEKFARMDLIGLPYQITIGPRGLENEEVEIKRRADGVRETLPVGEIVKRISKTVADELAVI